MAASWAVLPQAAAFLAEIAPPEAGILQQIRRDSAALRKADMAASADTVRVLVWLAGLTGAKKYLEAGVFTGYSSTALALALPADGRVTACDISVTYTDYARRAWEKAGVAHKIDLIVQPALTTLQQLAATQSGSYDLAFVDADKTVVPQYLEACLKLLRTGGIVALDNVFLRGKIFTDPSGSQYRCLKDWAQDSRVSLLTLPIGDGLALLRKN